MKIFYGLLFLVGHLEAIIPKGLPSTSASASTDNTPWHQMYRRDKYARDRVMKSARMLLPYLKDSDTVLDVGCFTHEARKYFPKSVRYIGLDSAPYHHETKVVDLNHGFEPISCNACLCLETLEHLIDPQDVLVSISKSLSDDGVLVVSVPNETTIFHRLRCLCGIVDSDCFSGSGKHLHLPNLKQARSLVSKLFYICEEKYYISPTACGSRQEWVGGILRLIPDSVHQWLADRFPSLFARGFIFSLKKRLKLGEC